MFLVAQAMKQHRALEVWQKGSLCYQELFECSTAAPAI